MMLSQCIRCICFYEPVKKTGWHIWKQQRFKRAEEEGMLTGTNFLQDQE